MELERIHYSNGTAIYDKRIWDAKIECGHLVTLSRDGLDITFISLAAEDEPDKMCLRLPKNMPGLDTEILARFVRASQRERSSASTYWDLDDIVGDLLGLAANSSVAVVSWASRRMLWMGHGWNILRGTVQANLLERKAMFTVFENDLTRLTTLEGGMLQPNMKDDNDIGYGIVANWNMSINAL